MDQGVKKYEPTYWDIGDENIEADQENLRRFVDEHVGLALKNSWKDVKIMFWLNGEGEPKVTAFGFSCEEPETTEIRLIDMDGWEGFNAGSEASRRLADVLEEIARKARASADEFDKLQPTTKGEGTETI